jgi:quercetin dioxygenase-like cupin family protein
LRPHRLEAAPYEVLGLKRRDADRDLGPRHPAYAYELAVAHPFSGLSSFPRLQGAPSLGGRRLERAPLSDTVATNSTTNPDARPEVGSGVNSAGRGAIERLRSLFGDDVALLPVNPFVDERGRLTELDFAEVPFSARRVFTVTEVPAGAERGGHRHRRCAQVLYCQAGQIEADVRRGRARDKVTLRPGGDALYLAAGVWSLQRYVEERSELLVLASEPFDRTDYEADY